MHDLLKTNMPDFGSVPHAQEQGTARPAELRSPPQQPLTEKQPMPTWYEGSGVYWTIRPCIWLPILFLWLLRRLGGCACCTPIIFCIWPPILFLWLLRSPPGGCACCTPITPWYVCCWLDIIGCKPVRITFKWSSFAAGQGRQPVTWHMRGEILLRPLLFLNSEKRASLLEDVKRAEGSSWQHPAAPQRRLRAERERKESPCSQAKFQLCFALSRGTL